MFAIFRPVVWFYHAFGLVAVQAAGRNAYLIIIARSCRMFAYGTNALILALFFSELHFSDHQIGLFMTLTLLGDVVLGTCLTLIADKVGRRRILAAGSLLMILSGVVFAYCENFGILLFAAVVGIVSATGGDFGPFRSIEESMLSHLTTSQTRADVLAWYVTASTLGSAIGSEASGRIVHFLQGLESWTLVEAYHALFWVYAAMGVVNAGLVMLLTEACEMERSEQYSQLPQDEEEMAESDKRPPIDSSQATNLAKRIHKNWLKRSWTTVSSSLTAISAPTRAVMYKLWLLLALDSMADGMVPYSLTNYYMDQKFHPAKSTLGDATSLSYLLGSISGIFAGPLSRKIGLINTMVFTHIPSSAAVVFFPLPSKLWMAVVLLLIRAGLNNMDQAPRSAFIAAVVRPEERTAVMGITNTLRTLAAMTGPTITGVLAGNDQFWVAFVAAGIFRLLYDGGLWFLFVNMALHQSEEKIESADVAGRSSLQPGSDDGSDTELQTLDQEGHEQRLDAGGLKPKRPMRLMPHLDSHVRRRSPSPMGKVVEASAELVPSPAP